MDIPPSVAIPSLFCFFPAPTLLCLWDGNWVDFRGCRGGVIREGCRIPPDSVHQRRGLRVRALFPLWFAGGLTELKIRPYHTGRVSFLLDPDAVDKTEFGVHTLRAYSVRSSQLPAAACTSDAGRVLRYSSVVAIVVSNVGQFATFSEAVCNRYYLAAPIFKGAALCSCVAATCVLSQQLTPASRLQWSRSSSVRSFSLYGHSPSRSGLEQLPLLSGSCSLCALSARASPRSSLAYRITRLVTVLPETCLNTKVRKLVLPDRSDTHRACTTVAWLHYVFSMSFDLVTLLISSWYLLGRQPCHYVSFGGIGRVMIVDGLGYFVLLTAVNVVNMIFYKTAPTALQSSAASLGYVVTMIGCQRILIHLRGALVVTTDMVWMGGDQVVIRADIADHSSNRTPRRPTTNGVSGEDRTHEMAIRVTITRDVEAYPEGPSGTKSSDAISTHKERGGSF